MFTIEDIEKIFENKSFAMEWDNVGVLINCKNKGNKILLAIDLTEKVVDEAIKLKCDFLIIYHPIIFKPIKNIVDSNYIKLIANSISVFSPHTLIDHLMNEEIFNMFKEKSFKETLNLIKETFKIETFDYIDENVNNNKEMRESLHVGVGSAFKNSKLTNSYIITGELSHHEMLLLRRNKNSVIILGHWYSEVIYLEKLKNKILNYFDNNNNEVIINVSKADCCPYKTFK